MAIYSEASVYILADNQYICKAGIQHVLKENGFMGRQYEVQAKNELIGLLCSYPEAIVVLDYTNFDFTRIEDLLILGDRFKGIRWILFSEELSLDFLKRIRLEEAFSVLLKNSGKDEIKKALMASLKQERYICPRIEQFIHVSKEKASAEKELLTSSEKEILKRIALGKSVKEIAEERFSSVHTITTHKKNIFRKLEVNNVHEATKYALRSGLIDTMDYYI